MIPGQCQRIQRRVGRFADPAEPPAGLRQRGQVHRAEHRQRLTETVDGNGQVAFGIGRQAEIQPVAAGVAEQHRVAHPGIPRCHRSRHRHGQQPRRLVHPGPTLARFAPQRVHPSLPARHQCQAGTRRQARRSPAGYADQLVGLVQLAGPGAQPTQAGHDETAERAITRPGGGAEPDHQIPARVVPLVRVRALPSHQLGEFRDHLVETDRGFRVIAAFRGKTLRPFQIVDAPFRDQPAAAAFVQSAQLIDPIAQRGNGFRVHRQPIGARRRPTHRLDQPVDRGHDDIAGPARGRSVGRVPDHPHARSRPQVADLDRLAELLGEDHGHHRTQRCPRFHPTNPVIGRFLADRARSAHPVDFPGEPIGRPAEPSQTVDQHGIGLGRRADLVHCSPKECASLG